MYHEEPRLEVRYVATVCNEQTFCCCVAMPCYTKVHCGVAVRCDTTKKGGAIMDEKKKPAVGRDYSKPIMLNLQGEKGLRTYIRIATSPRVKYDAAAAAEKARENLRRQGMNI